MIPVQVLHDALLQTVNHTDSKYFDKLSARQRDYYLNRGKDIVVEALAASAENNDTVRQHLRQITLRDIKLSATASGDKYIANLPADFFKPLGVRVIASKKGCQSRELIVRRLPSDKIFRGLKNANIKRMWDFEETIAIEGSNGLTVYREPDLSYEIFLDYIRKPVDVKCADCADKTYREPDGEIVTNNVDLELDSTYVWRKIVAMAALDIKNDYSLFNEYQTQRDKLLSIEKI